MSLKRIEPSKSFVRYLLSVGALELIPEGRKLNSGRISPYFLNLGLLCDGKEMYSFAKAYVRIIHDLDLGRCTIFGPAYKGIPLATAISIVMLIDHKISMPFIFNRKEIKGHGEGGQIVGKSPKKRNVVIVDEVITVGNSAGQAVDIVRANGGIPVALIVAFDREERISVEGSRQSASKKFQKKYGMPVHSITNVSDFIEVLTEDMERIPKAEETLPKILKYQQIYGV